LAYARRNFQSYQNRHSLVGREASMTFAWLLFNNGRSSEAEAALATLATGSTLSKENAYFVGTIYARAGKTQVAISALDAALATDASFPGRDEAQKLRESLKSDQ
jgi:ammonia channel protein AmtB